MSRPKREQASLRSATVRLVWAPFNDRTCPGATPPAAVRWLVQATGSQNIMRRGAGALAGALAAAMVLQRVAAHDSANATDDRIRIVGRGLADGAGGWVFDWPNSFVVSTQGAQAVVASISSNAWARFRVVAYSGSGGFTDGRWGPISVVNVAPGNGTYVLVAGLGDDKLGGGSTAPDAQTVTIVVSKMNEADYNEHHETDARVTMRSFSLPGGGNVVPVAGVPGLPRSDRKVEFIGDSITAAYGVAGLAPCTARPWQQEAGRSHAALTCAALSAQCHVQAWSGRGLVMNYEAEEPGTHMPEIERRVWGSVLDSPEWNFSSWVPDAVWVNLGTNDQCCGRKWPIPSFEPTLTALLLDITKRYAVAGQAPVPIFAAYGPVSGTYGPQVHAAVDAANAKGANAAAVDQTAIFPSGPGRVGCSGHPSSAGQLAMAQQAAASIGNATGWLVGPLAGENPVGALLQWST